jgi:hypothetical protein
VGVCVREREREREFQKFLVHSVQTVSDYESPGDCILVQSVQAMTFLSHILEYQ